MAEFVIGVVCGRCDRYSAPGIETCECGHSLALGPRLAEEQASPVDPHFEELALPSEAPGPLDAPALAPAPPPPDAPAPDAAKSSSPPPESRSLSALFSKNDLVPRRASTPQSRFELGGERRERGEPISLRPQGEQTALSSSGSLEELMEQAKNYVCRSCSTPVPMGHKFCGRCGAAIPPDILSARTQFFGQLQVPGKAKVILIRGDGVEGLSYQLNADQHVVGRNGQIAFTDDAFISPRHANLFYRGGKLVVRDEGSHNGVYLRVRGTVDIASGDAFLAGEQVFRVMASSRANDGPAPDGTYFYSSPKHQSEFRVVQTLQGGADGMAVSARGGVLQIGREGGDLNFPGDLFMSASHCKLEGVAGKLTLTDLNSRNGTYLRIKSEKELAQGDYLFIGRKLLRIEITAN